MMGTMTVKLPRIRLYFTYFMLLKLSFVPDQLKYYKLLKIQHLSASRIDEIKVFKCGLSGSFPNPDFSHFSNLFTRYDASLFMCYG